MRRLDITFKQSLWTLGLASILSSAGTVVAGGQSWGGGSTSGVAESEIIKRLERIESARNAEIAGDLLMRDSDFGGAYAKYQEALAGIPNAPNAKVDRDRIVAKYLNASLKHGEKLGLSGRREEAKSMLKQTQAEDIAPNNQDVKTLIKRLDDPEYTNPANTPKHGENVEKVTEYLRMGLGYFDLGDYKNADIQFNKVLAIDPYNTAARRLLEKKERAIVDYQVAARDHTRLRMMRQVDELWETAVPGTATIPDVKPPENQPKATSSTVFKLKNINLPTVQFDNTDIDAVIDYLRSKSKALDPTPAKDGVNFVLRVPDIASVPKITLNLENLPLIEVITQVCNLAQLEFRVEPFSVTISKIGGQAGVMDTKVFQVPPDFMSMGGDDAGGGGDAAAPADPFTTGGDNNKPTIKKRGDAKAVLVGLGADFTAPGSEARFLPGSSRLIVKNNSIQLELIDGIIEELMKKKPKQVQVTAKFVEVSQRNTDELGFDWLLGAFNVGSSGIFGSGGTTGNTGNLRTADFPFINPTSGTAPVPTGQNPITSSLRSGTRALTQNAIDGLLARTVTAGDISTATPATFAISGVFSDPQFQTLMRALSQKKGVDLLTAPTVVARSGQRAKIEVIREFPYPTDFDPPQIPQNFGGNGGFGGVTTGTTGGLGGVLGGGGGAQSFPVTPTTPTTFETKNTGVSMEIDPVLDEAGYTVELTLAPEVIEFEGFINYGSPINTSATNAVGVPTTVVLTENRIEQPVFNTRRLNTAVTIWDGQTVGIGGLIREDVQAVEDKVPLFGDIPFVGRLFKTKAEEHFKKNLMIYVTANVIDPSGQSIRDTRETSGSNADAGGADPSLLPPG
jgi:general secretion pathway protein D